MPRAETRPNMTKSKARAVKLRQSIVSHPKNKVTYFAVISNCSIFASKYINSKQQQQ